MNGIKRHLQVIQFIPSKDTSRTNHLLEIAQQDLGLSKTPLSQVKPSVMAECNCRNFLLGRKVLTKKL